jgi:integrase
VQDKIDGFVDRVLSGEVKPPLRPRKKIAARNVTVDEFLTGWLAGQAARVVDGSIAPRTLEVDRRNVVLHLAPALAGVLLADLDRQQVRELQASLFAKPRGNRRPERGPVGTLGRATVAQAMRILHTAVQQLVDDGILAENPCDRVKKPRRDRIEAPEALTTEQGAKLLRKAPKDSLPMGPARVASSCHLGLRESEALGLLETDLLHDCSGLLVRKGLARPAWTHGEGCGCNQNPDIGKVITPGRCPLRRNLAGVIGNTKTSSGVRVVPVPPALVPVFQAHLTLLHERRSLLADRWGDPTTLWLFPGDLGQTPSLYSDDKAWRRLVRRVLGPDAPTGTHAGRRHAATRLAEKGVPIHTAMEILGWSAAELMEVYARVGSEHKRREMARA